MASLRSGLYLILPFAVLAVACSPQPSKPVSASFSDARFSLYDDGEEVAPLLQGRRDYENLRPIEIPEVVRQRSAPSSPTAHEPFACGWTSPFRVHQPRLVIDVDEQVMDFKFEIESARGREKLHLRGKFQRNQSPWRANLYAADQKTLEERRVQAVALCLTAHRCDLLGVNIYYVLDGKGYCRQLQSGVRGPRVAMSGDQAPEAVPDVEASAGAKQPARPVSPAPVPQTGSQPLVSATHDLPEAVTEAQPAAERTEALVDVSGFADLTPEQLAGRVIEYDGVMQIDLPEESPYRIPDLPKAPVKPASAQPARPKEREDESAKKKEQPHAPVAQPAAETQVAQAFGRHDRGFLRNAHYLPPRGRGFVRQAALLNPNLKPDGDSSSAWGTVRVVEFLKTVGDSLEDKVPGAPMVVTSVSRRYGGLRPGLANCFVRDGRRICHGSHQNGLDIDILYFTKGENPPKGRNLVAGGKIVADFDVARTWELAKTIHRHKKDWLIVMFMDDVIKQALCQHARASGEAVEDSDSVAFQTLRSIAHWDGHRDHFHVRLYCPATEGCSNTLVSLPNGTGCRFRN